jgi:hypothetical protein
MLASKPKNNPHGKGDRASVAFPDRPTDLRAAGETAQMNKLTEYLDIPLTQALAQSFGAKLERLTAIDKLDAAQAILTAIAWGDIEQTHKPIAATVEEFGAVYPDAPNTDAFAAIVDAHSASIEDRLGLAAALCHQLHKGVYADAQ